MPMTTLAYRAEQAVADGRVKSNRERHYDVTSGENVYADEARVLNDELNETNALRAAIYQMVMDDPELEAFRVRYRALLAEHRHDGKLTTAIARDDARTAFYEAVGAWLTGNIFGEPRGPHC